MKFPVLSFSQGAIYVIHSADSMYIVTHCTRVRFNSGFYKRLEFVDSDGQKFSVTDARKVRRIPYKLNMMGFLGLISFNPAWEIELIFDPTSSKVSLEELKKMISNSFRNEKYMWREMADFAEFRASVSAATSIEQTIAIVGEIFPKSNQKYDWEV